eukprot:5645545-Pyramimonas_sp.AAC.1
MHGSQLSEPCRGVPPLCFACAFGAGPCALAFKSKPRLCRLLGGRATIERRKLEFFCVASKVFPAGRPTPVDPQRHGAIWQQVYIQHGGCAPTEHTKLGTHAWSVRRSDRYCRRAAHSGRLVTETASCV